MTSCNHRHLVLLPNKSPRLRCRHCRLTITSDELGNGCCPECYETDGKKRYEFEEIPAEKTITRYRCEDCGTIIEYRR